MTKLVLLAEKTMASTVAVREIIRGNPDKICAIVLSSQIKGSLSGQAKIAAKLIKKSSLRFFAYKFVESKLYNTLIAANRFFGRKKLSTVALAKKHNIPVIRTNDVNDDKLLQKIHDLQPDFVLCSISQILKQNVFDILGNKLINAHASKLPKYRGSSQYFWYLANGEKEFWITIHHMDKGLDTGDIILQKRFEIKGNISAYRLHYQIALANGATFNEFIQLGDVPRSKQNDKGASFSRMPTKEDMAKFYKKGNKLIRFKDFIRCV